VDCGGRIVALGLRPHKAGDSLKPRASPLDLGRLCKPFRIILAAQLI